MFIRHLGLPKLVDEKRKKTFDQILLTLDFNWTNFVFQFCMYITWYGKSILVYFSKMKDQILYVKDGKGDSCQRNWDRVGPKEMMRGVLSRADSVVMITIIWAQ